MFNYNIQKNIIYSNYQKDIFENDMLDIGYECSHQRDNVHASCNDNPISCERYV